MKFVKSRIMEKSFSFFLLLMFLSVSCSKKGSMDEKALNGENKYKRVVVMEPAVVEMMYMLGVEDKIAGIAQLQRSGIWPEDKTGKLENVGTFTNVSVEKVLSLKPDLVIVSSFYTPEGFEDIMKSNNIELKKISANTIEEIFTNFREIGKLMGKEKETEKIIAEKREKLDKVGKMEIKEQKGVFILSSAPMRIFGKGTLPDDIMKLFNIKNIADNMPGNSPVLTPEYLINENPDIILTLVKSSEEIVKANPQIKDVAAVKNKKIIVLDSNQVLRGSPRIIDHITEVYEKTQKN